MGRELNVIKFIREHPDNWEELLRGEPYYITARWGTGKHEGLVLLKYTQFGSDFTNPIVKECRGLILDAWADYQVVSYGFNKFLNVGEPGADEIDWSTARVQDKEDGSCCRVAWWKRGNDWLWSTLSSINAWDNKLSSFGSNFASFPTSVAEQSYAGMCESILFKKGIKLGNLSHDHTYIFELCTPYNAVVVKHDEPKLYHIGTRDNLTFEEINVDIGVEKPKEYPLHSLSAVLDAAEALNRDGEEVSKEGFVVVDANWHRIKVKSPLYLIKFHAVTTSLSLKNTLEIRLRGEQNEVISCFAESKPAFDALENLLDRMCTLMDEGYEQCCKEAKEQGDHPYYFVRAAKPKEWSGYYFWKRNHPDGTAKQFLLGGYILPDGRTTPPVVSIRDKVKYYWVNRDNEEVWHTY